MSNSSQVCKALITVPSSRGFPYLDLVDPSLMTSEKQQDTILTPSYDNIMKQAGASCTKIKIGNFPAPSYDHTIKEYLNTKLNTVDIKNTRDEDRKWSDMGNNTTQTPKTITPVEYIDKLREKIWRRSHSQRSVKTFDDAIKSFEKFLAAKEVKFEECMRHPLQTLDEYASWLDLRHSPSTTRMYVHFAKKTLKFAGAEISTDDFKERVTMPKKRPFQDDKVTRDQIRRIILGLNHLGLKVLLMLIKDTQARPAELLGPHERL